MSRATLKKQASSPGTPSTGYVSLWRRDNGDWVETDENGVDTVVGPVAPNSALVSLIGISIGDGLSEIIANTVGYSAPIPYGGEVVGWTMAEVSDPPIESSIVVDVGKDTTGDYPPELPADSMAGTEKPTLTAQKTNKDLTLTTWSASFNAEDCFTFKVESNTGAKKIHIILKVLRSS